MKQVDFYDIYDFIYIPFWKTTAFIVMMSILGATLLGTLAYFLYRRWKKKQLEKIPPPTPREWALRELAALTPESYESKEEFKAFYFALTRIYKQFLHKKFSWEVREKTDDELLTFLREKNFESDIIITLEKVFNGSLLIKFANAHALKAQALKDRENLKSVL